MLENESKHAVDEYCFSQFRKMMNDERLNESKIDWFESEEVS